MANPRKSILFLLAVAAGACWGTHGTFANLMGQYGVSDDAVSWIAPLFYGLFFLVLLIKDDFRKMKVAPKWIPLLFFYGFEAALFNFAIIKAYWHLPVGIVHTIAFSSLFPVILISRILFKDPLNSQKIICSIIAVLGIAMLLNVFGSGAWDIAGVVWAILAMLAWAGLVATEKYFLQRGFDGNAVLAYNGLFGVVLLSLVISPLEVVSQFSAAVVVSHGMVLLPLAGFAIVTSIASYYFYLRALRHLEPAYVQLAYVCDPLTATVLGFFLFDQKLLPIQIAGIIVILTVVVWVEVSEILRNRKADVKI